MRRTRSSFTCGVWPSCAALFLLWSALVTHGARLAGNTDAGASAAVARPTRVLVGKRGAGFWSVKGKNFLDANNNVVYFSGVIWSGFETPDAVPHGLQVRTYQSHLDQMKKLGFNMIRLAFAGDTLLPSTFPRSTIYGTNPELYGLSSLMIMDKIIAGCQQRGMKVILDYHRLHLTVANEKGLWWDETTPESVWINNWVMLAKRYKGNPTIIGADLFNEVHPNKDFPENAPYWQVNAGKNEKYNFRSACMRAMKAIHAVEPNWIIFIEGMHNNYWWGGNVLELAKAPIPDPRGKIAYSSHEYGPYVYPQGWFFESSFPKSLLNTIRSKWGIIQERGIKPVWVGEFGSFYPRGQSKLDKAERVAFQTLVAYIRAIKASWTLAFWDPLSKDTGGVLTMDWKTPNWQKMNLLRPIMYPNFGLPK